MQTDMISRMDRKQLTTGSHTWLGKMQSLSGKDQKIYSGSRRKTQCGRESRSACQPLTDTELTDNETEGTHTQSQSRMCSSCSQNSACVHSQCSSSLSCTEAGAVQLMEPSDGSSLMDTGLSHEAKRLHCRKVSFWTQGSDLLPYLGYSEWRGIALGSM